MHDLRRQALESGKTVSRKARSRQTSRQVSRTNSQPTSGPGSRSHSRHPSDDEDAFSDDTSYSINSIDEFLASDDFNEAAPDLQKQQLSDRIDELLARKGSTNKGREDCIAAYIRFVSAHLVADILYGRVKDIVAAFARSIKAETSERETVLALRALSLTAISIRDDHLYDSVSDLVKRTISDSQSLQTKAAAIYALGDCLSYGGAADDEIVEQMVFLLEIISSDGAFVDASDDAGVVVAALHVYGFLATQIHDVEAESEDAVDAFLEQLDSTSAEVQVAAGENIALFYEKAARVSASDDSDDDSEEEEDGDDDDDDDDDDDRSNGASSEGRPSKRYEPYHNSGEVASKAEALASLSGKKLDRKSKKTVHQAFRAILLTIEDPTRGLQWNNKSHMVIRIHQEGEMYIDRWWKLMRLNALRRLLQGGFVNHYYEGNKAVLDMLPVLIDRKYQSVGTPEKGRKYKDQSYSPRSLGLMQGN